MPLSLDQVLGQLDISSAGFRRAEGSAPISPSALPGQVHFIAVLSGGGLLQSQSGALDLKAGYLLLLPGHVDIEPPGDAVLAHGFLGATLLDGRCLFDLVPLPLQMDASGTELFTSAVPELLRESAYAGPGSASIITCLARRLVTTFLRDAWASASEIHRSDMGHHRHRGLSKIVELMKKDPGRDYTLDVLAEAAGMSRTVFHREFLAVYGSSPLTMLRSLRLNRAEELLRQTDMPIKTITARLGYRSRSHFWKLFKDAHGTDPDQFRSQCQRIALDEMRAGSKF